MRGAANPEHSPSLEARKMDLEARLRSKYSSFTRNELSTHASLRPYIAYYKGFGKTYHVQLQLE